MHTTDKVNTLEVILTIKKDDTDNDILLFTRPVPKLVNIRWFRKLKKYNQT